MKVITSELPLDLRKQLPISLQLTESFDSSLISDSSLRLKIESYLLSQSAAPFLNNQPQTNIPITSEYINTNQLHTSNNEIILDFVPEISSQGLTQFTDYLDFIIFNLRNFIKTKKGINPFDPDFGTSIYEVLKTLDLNTAAQTVQNELNEFISQLKTIIPPNNSDYNSIKISSVKFKKIIDSDNTGDYVNVSYLLNITLETNNEAVEISNELKL
jgi:hypothetical protein